MQQIPQQIEHELCLSVYIYQAFVVLSGGYEHYTEGESLHVPNRPYHLSLGIPSPQCHFSG